MAGAFAVALLLQVEIELAEPAFGGLYRPNQWNFVVVRLRAGAAGWSGNLGVRVENGPESVMMDVGLPAGFAVTRLVPTFLPPNPGALRVRAGIERVIPAEWSLPREERTVLVLADGDAVSLRREGPMLIREVPRAEGWNVGFALRDALSAAVDVVVGLPWPRTNGGDDVSRLEDVDPRKEPRGIRFLPAARDWRRLAEREPTPRIARRRARAGLLALGLCGLLSLGAAVASARWGRSPTRSFLPWALACAVGTAIAWAAPPRGFLEIRTIRVDVAGGVADRSYDVLMPRADPARAATNTVEWIFGFDTFPISPPKDAAFRFLHDRIEATLPTGFGDSVWIEVVERGRVGAGGEEALPPTALEAVVRVAGPHAIRRGPVPPAYSWGRDPQGLETVFVDRFVIALEEPPR